MIKKPMFSKRTLNSAVFLVLLLMQSMVMSGEEKKSVIDEKPANSALSTIRTNQTSANYLREYMTIRYKEKWLGEENQETERQRLGLVTDIFIKAWSYSFINKIFFVISIILAFAVLLWPSISAVAPKSLGEKPIFKSAVVQTTITALAAASFFIYSDYKDKHQSAENLMRYVIYSNDDIQPISAQVMEELSRIDKGFSFSKVIPGTGDPN